MQYKCTTLVSNFNEHIFFNHNCTLTETPIYPHTVLLINADNVGSFYKMVLPWDIMYII